MKTQTSAYRLTRFGAKIFLLFSLIFCGCLNHLFAQGAEKNHPALKSKQYQRSEWFTSARVDSSGSMGTYLKAIQKFQRPSSEREIPGNYQSTQWYPLGPSKCTNQVLAQLGLVISIWVDTSDFKTLYAGSNTGGIFKTTDGGENWFSLTDTIMTTGVLSIQVDPRDKNKIFIGTGHFGYGRAYGIGILKSQDGGINWQKTGLTSELLPANFMVREIELLPEQPETMLALLNTEYRQKGYIYRSSDGAQTWEPVYSGNKAEFFSIIPDPGNPEVIYVTGTKFLKSIDSGLNWVDYSDRIPLDTNFIISRVEIAKTANDPDLMLAMVESYDTVNTYPTYRLNLYKSTNNGGNFSKIDMKYNPFAGYWKMEFEISAAHSDEFYLGGIWLYKYRIEGDSAKFIYCSDHKYHHDIRDLHVFPGKEKDVMYMANDGGVTKSETGAESWQDITRNGMNITQFYNITIGENSDMMYAGPQDANLSFYNFKTKEWTKNAKVSDAYEGAIDPQNPDIVYLITFPPNVSRPHIFIMKSTNGGNFFNYFGIPDSTEIGRNDKPLVLDPVDPNTLYVGVRNVWKSTDGALTFEKISNFPATGDPKLITVKVAPSNNKVIVAGFENPNWTMPSPSKLWITPDGGSHWFNITPVGSINLDYAGISDITFHPEIPRKMWLSLANDWVNHHVYMTSDGGQSWQNFSEGLPELPVNTVTFLNGAGFDILLAATDVGIYYRDEYMDRWEEFGHGLPRTIVSDIKISYSRKKIIAGTFGRGLWEADLCMPLIEGDLVINDTIEWSGKRKVLQNVVVNPGGKLIVSSTIEMGLDRRISVMPGGELVIDRGILTNDCIGMWDGIRLYGANDFNNQLLPQGKLTILHGGTIQYADTAVRTTGVNDAGQVISGSGGGIIKAENAKFINNLQGVDINPSTGNNPSEFTLCQFVTNKTLPDGTIPGDLVNLKGSSGIKFISCQFENNLPFSSIPFHERGIGINSLNSSFLIGKLSSLDSVPFGLNSEAVFKQLAYGIRAISTAPGFSADITRVKFERTLTGVYLGGMNLSNINNCIFNLNSPNVNDSLKPAVTAIYSDQCPYLILTDNIITGQLGALVPKSKTAGIIINRSGQLNQTIYGNSITKTNYAILAQNSNRNQDGSTGLRFCYNWFNENEYDICVTNDSTSSNNGIALHQGSTGLYPAAPAENRFSYSTWHRDADFHNSGEMIYYHYSDATDTLNRKPLSYYRNYLISNHLTYPTDSAYRPDYFLSGDENLVDDLNHFNNLNQQIGSSFKNKLDGGDTEALILEINRCSPYLGPDLAAKLISFSPYLSPAVLVALTKEQKSIPNTLIFKILSLNQHFIRSKQVMDAIAEMKPQLPDYMRASLAQAYTQYSQLEMDESRVNATRSIRDLLFDKYSLYLRDDVSDIEALKSHLLTDNRPESHYLASFRSLNAGNPSQAKNILETIPGSFPELDIDVNNNISDLFRINNETFPAGKEPSNLTENQINQLHQLMLFPETDIYATNILKYYGMIEYSEPYIFPGIPGIIVPPVIPPINFSGSGFRIYPVPAGDYVILDYFSETGFTNGKLLITTSTGQLIQKINIDKPYGQQFIDVSQLDAGTYIFILRHDGGKIGEQKVIIVR